MAIYKCGHNLRKDMYFVLDFTAKVCIKNLNSDLTIKSLYYTTEGTLTWP